MNGYDEQTWVNGESQANAQRFNHMEAGIKNAYNVSLIAITNIEPSEYNEGDKYFNTSDNLIYTATSNNEWSETGETPISDKTYVLIEDGSTYMYNGTALAQIGGKQINGETPIGGSQDYWGTTDPNENWLIMNGRALSRTDYAELFAVIGTTYGEGDGSTTFNIPKYDGRVAVGLDTNDADFNVLGKTGGGKKSLLPIQLSNSGFVDFRRTTVAGAPLPDWENYRITFSHTESDLPAETNWGTFIEGVNENQTSPGNGNLSPYIVCNKIIRVK